MGDKQYTFLQSITINGYDIDVRRVVSLSYTEHLDLSGPSIILEVRDEQSYIRDDYELAAGVEIVLEMGDVYGIGEEYFSETFIVSTFPVTNNIIKIEGFQTDCASLKEPAGKPLFYTDKSPSVILAALLPDLTVECSVAGQGTYHLNQGKTPSRLLRDMARDYGACCWISRGTVYFKKITAIAGGDSLLQIGLNSIGSDVEIARYNKVNDGALYDRVVQKSYSSWSPEDRYKSSSTNSDKQSVLIAYPLTTTQLDNQCIYVLPSLDVVVLGDARYEPGVCFDIEIIKLTSDASLDESVDSSMFIKSVTHYVQGSKYNNRMILGVANGA